MDGLVKVVKDHSAMMVYDLKGLMNGRVGMHYESDERDRSMLFLEASITYEHSHYV